MSLQAVLESWGAKEVSPMEVYTDIFRLGTNTIQCDREPKGKYKSNPIVYFKNENEENGHYRILFDDTFEETLKIAQAADFAIIMWNCRWICRRCCLSVLPIPLIRYQGRC